MTADTVGGVWSYAVELATVLGGRGVRVELATMGAPLSDAQRAQVAAISSVTVHESGYRLEWMEEPWADVERAGRWLLDLERSTRPDLVHLNQFAFGALPFRAPTLLVAHSCVLSWWRAVHGTEAPASWDRYRAVVTRGLVGATLVAAPTRAMLASLAEHYAVDVDAIVLPNGRCADDFRPAGKAPVIVSAGRLWDEAKNLRALDHVAPSLDWPVRVAGSMRHPDGAGVTATGVTLLGPLSQPELARELSTASVFALPARYEPFGLAALEAALAGCALVLGDVPSLREVWGRAAVFVPPDDHDALRAALQRLMDDPVHRARMAAAARGRALTYSPDGMAGGVPGRLPPVATAPPIPRWPRRPTPSAGGAVRIVMFYHSLVSDWNHGNAHFLRGVCSELLARGHDVAVYEPRDAWSVQNLIAEHGHGAAGRLCRRLSACCAASATSRRRSTWTSRWTAPTWCSCTSGATTRWWRASASTAPPAATTVCSSTTPITAPSPTATSMAAYDLRHYDGVLAFGARDPRPLPARGLDGRAWTWHEAADTRVFHPLPRRADARATWCGSATGATTSAPPSCRSSCSTRCTSWGCARASTACAIRTQAKERLARGRHRVRRLAAQLRGAARVRPLPRARCTCRVARMWRRCPASRPSASSRRWPAASRW